MQKNKWPAKKLVKLISEFQTRPYLWDKEHEDYKTHEIKKKGWLEMDQVLDVKRHEAKYKTKILMSQYRRECRKVAVEANYKSKWLAFRHLSFLDKPSKSKGSKQNVKSRSNGGSRNFKDDDVNDLGGTSPAWENPFEEKVVSDFDEADPRNLRPGETRDHLDMFGQYVVEILRKFDPLTRAKMERKIMSDILEAEIKLLEDKNIERNLDKYSTPGPSTSIDVDFEEVLPETVIKTESG